MRFVKAVGFVVSLLLLAAGIGIASGAYDIGADAPHWSITQRAIELLRDRSIAQHAQSIAVPDLSDPKRLAEGAEHYAAMCTGCHLAPGQSDSELRRGLYPMPPNLSQAGTLDPAQAFWVIKHGVKLTAMPAWGKSHDDAAIWNLVAFVRQLPRMTPEQYQQATANAGAHAHHHHGGGEDEHHGEDAHEHADDADHGHGAQASPPPATLEQRQADVRARGPDVMAFALGATQHVFEKTPNGGTQRVRARDGHTEQVPLIRAHLKSIAQAFAARDFSGPAHIHGAGMAGLAELAAAPTSALQVSYRDLGDGAELTYRAETDALRDAVHRWFDAQLADHGGDATDGDGTPHAG